MTQEMTQIRRSVVDVAWSTWAVVAAEVRACGDWWIRVVAWMTLSLGLGGLLAVGILVALVALGAPVGLIVLGCLAGFATVTAAWTVAWITGAVDSEGEVGRRAHPAASRDYW